MEDWFIKEVLAVATIGTTEREVRECMARYGCLYYKDINRSYQYSKRTWLVMIGSKCLARHEVLQEAITLADEAFRDKCYDLLDPNT